MIAVIGAGAMGTALAIVHARAGVPTMLLGTMYDDAAIAACRDGGPHPALGIALDDAISCHAYDEWSAVLARAETVLLGVSSDGLAGVVVEVAALARPSVRWITATKGWDPETLRTPSEVIGSVVGGVAVLAGPALAPELAAGAPVAMVCASSSADLARDVATSLAPAGVSFQLTDDVAAVEIAAAYKNVTAIAVGICEGLADRELERVFVHRYANARAAMFAQGLRDMSVLAKARGGRDDTILGLAGAGDLYVTCLGGRNGRFGRLLGAGETAEQAQATIGSTVEGVPNAAAALAIAARMGAELPVARAVSAVLSGELDPEDALMRALAGN